jgi:8-oxo-dGTP diphosphatase
MTTRGETGGVRPRPRALRSVDVPEPEAPVPAVVTPSVFVAVREEQGRLLLVKRCGCAAWELPGGRVDVGESAVEAAVRMTAGEAGLRARITGLVGLFTDPARAVETVGDGKRCQEFVACFHGWAEWGRPRPNRYATSDAAWFDPAVVTVLALEARARRWIHHALAGASEPHLG